MILLIIVLVLVFGLGGGYYGTVDGVWAEVRASGLAQSW
jgi:hypothetical protein